MCYYASKHGLLIVVPRGQFPGQPMVNLVRVYQYFIFRLWPRQGAFFIKRSCACLESLHERLYSVQGMTLKKIKYKRSWLRNKSVHSGEHWVINDRILAISYFVKNWKKFLVFSRINWHLRINDLWVYRT